MSYYILPKKNIVFDIIPSFVDDEYIFFPIISNSVYYYLNDINNRYKKIINNKCEISKIVNPYEFVHSLVLNSNISVSKINAYSNTFYVYIEIINMLSLIDFFDNININVFSYGRNSPSVIECLNLLREDYIDFKLDLNEININDIKKKGYCIDFKEELLSNVHLLSYELNETDYININNYTIGLIYILCNIICYQSQNGVSIIKVDNIYYKPTLDIIYILTSMYEKIYIIKPNISNILSNEKYIVCKNYIYNETKNIIYKNYLVELNSILLSEKIIKSILDFDLPFYFLNKIEDSNIIIGNQQIEYLNHLLYLYKSKNTFEKQELLKKNNIQKCIMWCEKFKIPNNKFIEKLNIFLNNDEKIVQSNDIINDDSNNIISYVINDEISYENNDENKIM